MMNVASAVASTMRMPMPNLIMLTMAATTYGHRPQLKTQTCASGLFVPLYAVRQPTTESCTEASPTTNAFLFWLGLAGGLQVKKKPCTTQSDGAIIGIWHHSGMRWRWCRAARRASCRLPRSLALVLAIHRACHLIFRLEWCVHS